jgi:hypothetical protein
LKGEKGGRGNSSSFVKKNVEEKGGDGLGRKGVRRRSKGKKRYI